MQRPFAAAYLAVGRRVLVRSSFPQVWHDLPVELVRSSSPLRANQQQTARHGQATWAPEPLPGSAEIVQAGYQTQGRRYAPHLEPDGIMGDLERSTRARPRESAWRLPIREEWRTAARAKLEAAGVPWESFALVRPPTLRREWPAPGRNPDPRAFWAVLREYADAWHWVAAGARLEPGEEELAGITHGWSTELLRDELELEELFAAVAQARVVLAPIGYVLPLACALEARAFFVLGGHVPMRALLHREQPWDRIGWVQPDPFCACGNPRHDCPKPLAPERCLAAFAEFLEGTE